MIDIVDIKGEVEQGKITAYVKDGAIYLRNDIGEIVKIGEVESKDKCKKCEYYRNPDYTRCHECKAESEEQA